jgi:hypothetical protein
LPLGFGIVPRGVCVFAAVDDSHREVAAARERVMSYRAESHAYTSSVTVVAAVAVARG